MNIVDPNVSQWWIIENDEAVGPYSHSYISQRLKNGLSARTMACRSGATEWRKLINWPEFQSVIQSTPLQPAAATWPSTVNRQPVSAQATSSRGPQWPSWLPLGMVFGVIIGLMIFNTQCRLNSRNSSAVNRALAEIKASDQQYLQEHRQEVFQLFHPIGKATAIKLHDVSLVAGQAKQPQLEYRFTIYWEGPLTKDGYTKVHSTFDIESHRIVGMNILATNGTTNAEAQQMLVEFGMLMGEMALREQQQRRQYEQQIRRGLVQ